MNNNNPSTVISVLPVPFENRGERVLRLQQHVVALQTDRGNILGGTNAVDINSARIEYFTRDRGTTIQQPTVAATDDSFIHGINDRFLERAVSINLGDAPHDTVTSVVAQVAESNSAEELGAILSSVVTQNGVTVDLANWHAGLHALNSQLANNPGPLLDNFTHILERGRLRRHITPVLIEYITGVNMDSFSVSLFSLFLLFGLGGLDQISQLMTSHPGLATSLLIRFFRWVLVRILNFDFWLYSSTEIAGYIRSALRHARDFLHMFLNRVPTSFFYRLLRRIVDFGVVQHRRVRDYIRRGMTSLTRHGWRLSTLLNWHTMTVLFGGVGTLYGLMVRYPELFTNLIRLLLGEQRTIGQLAKEALKRFLENLFR